MRRLVAATAMSVLMLAGCAPGSGSPATTAPDPTPPAAPSLPAQAAPLLAEYGLDGKNAVQVIDHLDRLGISERPADLKASVRPDELILTREGQELRLGIPDDRFYLSVAPYLDRTHDCYHHSLTTCKGELTARDVQVKIVDETNDKVLVDQVTTTFANGFVGFWLPRDIEGTVRISYGGKAGQTRITTGSGAPTCLTTLRLS